MCYGPRRGCFRGPPRQTYLGVAVGPRNGACRWTIHLIVFVRPVNGPGLEEMVDRIIGGWLEVGAVRDGWARIPSGLQRTTHPAGDRCVGSRLAPTVPWQSGLAGAVLPGACRLDVTLARSAIRGLQYVLIADTGSDTAV